MSFDEMEDAKGSLVVWAKKNWAWLIACFVCFLFGALVF